MKYIKAENSFSFVRACWHNNFRRLFRQVCRFLWVTFELPKFARNVLHSPVFQSSGSLWLQDGVLAQSRPPPCLIAAASSPFQSTCSFWISFTLPIQSLQWPASFSVSPWMQPDRLHWRDRQMSTSCLCQWFCRIRVEPHYHASSFSTLPPAEPFWIHDLHVLTYWVVHSFQVTFWSPFVAAFWVLLSGEVAIRVDSEIPPLPFSTDYRPPFHPQWILKVPQPFDRCF